MTDIEVDLNMGLEADGWPRGTWRKTLRFDKNDKNIMIKLKSDLKNEEVIIAVVEIKVR